MQTLNKKGLSDVVANLLIILLGISAVALIASTSYQLINTDKLEEKYSCYKLKLASPISIQKACLNRQTNEIEITTSRKLDGKNFSSFQIITQRIDENSLTYSCGDSCNNCRLQEVGSSKKFFITAENNPIRVSIAINGCLLDEKQIFDC